VHTQRGLVDYALRRRSVLAGVTSGQIPVSEVCDASPYLLQAARFHGVAGTSPCPVCRKENLTTVFWAFGDEIGHASGSARSPVELERLAEAANEFTVHQVEVCRTCSWNHLVASFVMGHGDPGVQPRKARRSGT
jgi:hypothetical protein